MNQPQTPPTVTLPAPSGLRVRSDVRAGAWRCNTCAGAVTGNKMLQPECAYCEQA